MSYTFKDGAAVDSVTWDNDESITGLNPGVKSMEISMEPGHMGMIPFVRINYVTGKTGMVSVDSVFVVLKEAKDG